MGLRTPIGPKSSFRDNPVATEDSLDPTFSESAGAAFDLSANDSASASVARILELNEARARGGAKIPAQELNSRFPGLEEPFTEDHSLEVAQLIADRQGDRRRLADIVARGPEGPLASTGRFGASLLPFLFDPLELATSLAAGGLVAKVGRLASRAGKVNYLTTATPTGLQKFGRASTEGLVGNIAVEPVVAFANNQDQLDYTAADTFFNVTTGAIGFPAAMYGISKTFAAIRRLSPKHLNQSVASTVGQLSMDRRVDTNPLTRTLAHETSGARVPGFERVADQVEYKYRPIDGTNVRGQQFYAAQVSARSDFGEGVRVIDEDLGDGIYLSDNAAVANGHAGVSGLEGGAIARAEMGEAKLLDLDQKLDDEVKEIFREFVEKAVGKKAAAQNVLDFQTGKEIYDQIIRPGIAKEALPDDSIHRLNGNLQDAGFDGIRHKGGTHLGAENAPHNVLMMFSPDKMKETGRFAVDQQAVPREDLAASQTEALQKLETENHIDYVEAENTEFRKFFQEANPETRASEVEARSNELVEELSRLDKQGVLDDADRAVLDDIKKLTEERRAKEEVIDVAANCLLRG